MKAVKVVKAFAIATVSCIFVASPALADEHTPEEVAAGWSLGGNILTNTVTGWAFQVGGNASARSITSVKSQIFEELDLSALDGEHTIANDSTFKLTEIGNNTFKNRSLLTSVTLPITIAKVGQSAFANCTNLTEIVNISKVTSFGGGALSFTKLSGELKLTELKGSLGSLLSQTQVTRVEIPKVTELTGGTFWNCTQLVEIVMTSVTNMARTAIENCSKFPCLDAPQVEHIGTLGLHNASSLTKLIVPSLTSMDTEALRNCKAIKSVKFPHCMKENIIGSQTNFWFRYSGVETNYVHRMSPLAQLEDATIRINGNNTVIIRYGGAWSNENETVEWYYDDRDTDDYEKNENVTIVAAPALIGADVQIPKAMTYVDLNEDGTPGETMTKTVTAIEACSFKKNVGLASVKVPNTVTRIGVAAFPKGCYIKVRASEHAEELVAQLNAEYGTDGNGDDYASVDNGGGFFLILR